MRLRQKALKAINNPNTRRLLMDALGCTEFTIAGIFKRTAINLTKAAALEVIRTATGFSDSEILEQETKVA